MGLTFGAMDIERLRAYRPSPREIDSAADPADGTVVIAMVDVMSMTGDSVAVSVRREGDGYELSVSDEHTDDYPDGGSFEGYVRRYEAVPTQGEVLDAITTMKSKEWYMWEGQPYVAAILCQFEDLAAAGDFLRVSSDWYPNLSELFRAYLRDEDPALLFSMDEPGARQK